MQNAFSPHSGPRFGGSFEEWLPGLELTHILYISSALDLDAVISVLSCIGEVQDSIDRWSIARRGSVLDQRIWLSGINEGSARSLRERLAQIDKGLRVRLEHQCKKRVQPASK